MPSEGHESLGLAEHQRVEDEIEALLAVRRRQRRRRRLWVLLIAASMLPLFGVYFWFAQVVRPTLVADLWLRVDAEHAPGGRVGIAASSRDPSTGAVVDASYEATITVDDAVVFVRPIQGESRFLWALPERADAEVRVTLAMDDARIGPVSVSETLRPGRVRVASRADRRGGLVGSAGIWGVGLVRDEGTCGYSARALTRTGAPVASVASEILLELKDAQGAPLAGVWVDDGASSRPLAPHRAKTDASGLVQFTVMALDREYLEVKTTCTGGEQLFGFEVQPMWDGIGVTRLASDPVVGVSAVVESSRQTGQLWWDLRCAGDVVAQGVLPGVGGEVTVGSMAFAGVAIGERCALSVYRDLFATDRGFLVLPLRWGADDLSAAWSDAAGGLAWRGGEVYRAQPWAAAALEAWSARQRGWIRATLLGIIAVYGAVWSLVLYVLYRRGLGSSIFRADAGLLDETRGDLVSWVGAWIVGWIAIGVSVGGFWMLLGLMGL